MHPRSMRLTRVPLSKLGTGLAAAGLIAACLPALAQTGSNKDGIQEVVITANKISTLASKTPVAISVIDGDQLKASGVIDARALQELSPSVQIGQETGRLQINIRGVMSINNTERGDPSNAFNVDGIYIGRPEAQLASFLDVQRIEVLRGPQGTLYGRNATGGAVNVITNKPGNRLGGRASVELGSYNARRVEAAIDVPINDLLKLRAAAGANKRDSYLKGGAGFGLEDQDDRAARVHALLTFSPATTLLLTAESAQINSNGFTPVSMKNFFTGTPKGGNANWYNDLLDPVYISGNETAKLTVDPFYARATQRLVESNALRAELRHSLGWADVVYQVGGLSTNTEGSFIGPFNGAPFLGQNLDGTNKQVSHELRMNSAKGGALAWVVGAYLFDEDLTRNTQYNTFINPNFTFRLKFQPVVENKAQAVFGQTSYSVMDTLRVVTGLRFSEDTKFASDPFNGGGLTIPVSPFSRTVKSSKTTYKLGLDWDFTKDTFVYGSVSSGYKAGGFNTSSDTATYNPETLTALEAGVKTRLFDNRLQLSASAFSYDYQDLQVSSTVCLANAAGVSTCGTRTVNAQKAKMAGLEFEGRMRVLDDGMLDFGVSLNRTRFGTYTPINRPATAPNLVIDYTGQNLDRAPKATARFGYTHTIGLASGAAIELNGSVRYNAGYLLSSYGNDYATRYRQPSFSKVDARATWRSADDKYSVQVFGKNLTNEITVETLQPGAINPGEPRTFGVRVGATF